MMKKCCLQFFRRSNHYFTKFHSARKARRWGKENTYDHTYNSAKNNIHPIDENQPNPRVLLSVVCDGADGSNSIILNSWPNSYVFNFGEGFQMSCAAYGRGNRTDGYRHQHMFVTHSSWKNVGGLLGYIQGRAAGKVQHTLHGPCKYKEVLNSLKRTTTVYLSESNDMQLNIMKETHSHFEDSQLRIDYVKLSGEHVFIYGEKVEKLACAYIIKPKRCSTEFRLNAEKLVNLNVEWGPMTEALRRGESVTLDDGRIINPKQVMSGAGIIHNTGSIVVLECPSESYLDSLLSAPEFIDLPKDPEWSPDLIVHFSPRAIINSKKYRDFMKRFDQRTTHYMLNEGSYGRHCSVYETYRKTLTDWNPDLFPELYKDKSYLFTKPQPGTKRHGFVGQQYSYRTRKWTIVPPKDVHVVLPVKERKGIVHRKQVNLDEYPEVVFLGTGSSVPHLVRNVAGILVQMRSDEYIMLDCGESTYRQMKLLYGPSQTKHILQNLKAIFVSHKHYDHLGGVPTILDQWMQCTKDMDPQPHIYLLCPIEMKEIVLCYNTLLGGDYNKISTVYHNPLFAWKDSKQTVPPPTVKRTEEFKKDIGFDEYLAVVVPHLRWCRAYGVVIKHKDGWKLVYTGDTTHKCKTLIDFGRDCDILIHDATYPDHLEERAHMGGHSTYKQAIENGKQMNAKYTILTHFTSYFSGAQYNTENAGVAFDHMKFRPSQGSELSEVDLVQLHANRDVSITLSEAHEQKRQTRRVRKEVVIPNRSFFKSKG